LACQTHGELDEARLVDGAAGDQLIYRRRGERPPDPGAPHMKPKRLRFVLDVSGSMYRFNSEDRRLERCCQMAVMLMESCPRPPPRAPRPTAPAPAPARYALRAARDRYV